MRRILLIVAIIIQICLTPICHVFALSADETIITGGKEFTSQAYHHHAMSRLTATRHTDMDCCASGTVSVTSALNGSHSSQTQIVFHHTPQKSPLTQTEKKSFHPHSDSRHPPDDFERSSQSKRE